MTTGSGNSKDSTGSESLVSSTPQPRLGINLGHTIVAPYEQPAEREVFWQDAAPAWGRHPEDVPPPAAGIWEYLPDLVQHYSRHGGDIYLISQIHRHEAIGVTHLWFILQSFFERTGLKGENVRFVDGPANKATIAQRLGLTHYIDDRVEPLDAMAGIVPVRVLFGQQTDSAQKWAAENEVLWAPDWNVATQHLKWTDQFLPRKG